MRKGRNENLSISRINSQYAECEYSQRLHSLLPFLSELRDFEWPLIEKELSEENEDRMMSMISTDFIWMINKFVIIENERNRLLKLKKGIYFSDWDIWLANCWIVAGGLRIRRSRMDVVIIHRILTKREEIIYEDTLNISSTYSLSRMRSMIR